MTTALLAAIAAFVSFPADLNVRDFGAKGDGVTDDTAAIQRAADAGYRFAQAHMERVGISSGCGGQGDAVMPRIVFPAGTYLVSTNVVWRRDHQLYADGEVVIRAASDETDLFFLLGSMRHFVSGFTFEGGCRQLHIDTRNNESANIRIRDCRFLGAKGTAVEALNPGKPNSTFLSLERCEFRDPVQAADISPDGAVFRELKVVSAVTTGCVFRVRNNLRMYNVEVALKRPAGADHLAFIEGSGFHGIIEKSAFRSLDGRGIALLRHNGKCKYIGRALILRDLDLDCGGCPEGAIVCCENHTTQEVLSLSALRDHTGRPVQAIRYEGGMTLADLDANRHFRNIPSKKVYTVVIEGNSANIGDDLPEDVRRFRERVQAVPEAPRCLRVPREPGGEVIRVTEPTAAAVKEALTRAAELERSVVMLPPAKIRLEETLKVRGRVTLTAAGVAMLVGEDPAKDLFEVESGSEAYFSHLFLWKGRRQLVCRAAKGSNTRIVLDTCCTFDAGDTALVMETEGDLGDLKLLVDGGVHYHRHWYEGNADAILAEAWYRLYPVADPKTMPDWCRGLVNRGRLRYQDILGVPIIMTEYRNVPEAELPKGDFRWIDNEGGELYSSFSRWGGEGGGVPPVYNSKGGRVLIEGSYGYFYPRNTVHCPVLTDEPEGRGLRFYGVSCGFEIDLWHGGLKFMYRRPGEKGLRPTESQAIECVIPRR